MYSLRKFRDHRGSPVTPRSLSDDPYDEVKGARAGEVRSRGRNRWYEPKEDVNARGKNVDVRSFKSS